MATEHPNKILAHDPVPPFPKVFRAVFMAVCLYLVIIFAVTGVQFVVTGGHGP